MTLGEKCGCLTGEGYWVLGGCPKFGIDPIEVADGPHGLRKQSGAFDNLGLAESEPAVCFPTASAAACTFDVNLIRTMGEAIGDEARDKHVAVVLGPGVNMKRSPLCGRNFEYFSEDPYLAGTLATAYISGIQSRGIGASLKHFTGNNQERNRLIVDSVIDDRALNEVYLEPFRMAIEQAQPWTVMTAYNLLNGTYCSENEYLMTELARDAWGFRGAFVTDWGAENASIASIEAGLDLVMPGPRPDYRASIQKAVQEGRISEDRLDAAVRRVLELHEKHEREQARVTAGTDVQDRLDLACVVAEEAAVLLKNDGLLPFPFDANIAVIGAFACEPRYQGAGSSKINPVALDCALDELRSLGIPCTYAAGYDAKTGESDESLLAEAADAAVRADVAVVFVGLPDASESEGSDRIDMRLPVGHNRLVEAVCAANRNTVVVIQGGSPVEMPWRGKPRAILLSYLAGCQGGRATARILSGKTNPSGKLAETWPETLADTPCAGFFPAQGRQVLYREGIYTGYRYYDTAEIEVAYPFGFGLSYTSFSYRDMRIEQGGEGYLVSCSIRNEGERAGKEIVQLYIAPIDPCVYKAAQQLKGFEKVLLEPGEERQVTFEVPRRAFAHFDTQKGSWDVETGCYELRIASSSRNVRLAGSVKVAGSSAMKDDAPAAYRNVEPGGFTEEAFRELYGKPFPKVQTTLRPYTPNATIGDLKSSLIGRLVRYLLRRELKLLLRDNVAARQAAELMMTDVPLRALAMSGVDMRLVYGVVDILNYRFIRGIKRLAALKPSD